MMKLPLTPGEYLFTTGAIYFVAGMVNIFVHRFTETEYIQMVWLLVAFLPVVVPLPRLMRGSPFWKT